MSKRSIRVGIDVGGTHTKAVALDNDTQEIVGEAIVMTTHDHELGVAAGVIECFENCLTKNNIAPEDVVFIAHSTTQATNALLEGDVAKVGILGMAGGGLEGWLAKKQSKIGDIDLDDFFPEEKLDSTMAGKSQESVSKFMFEKSKEYATRIYNEHKDLIHSGKVNYMFLEIDKATRAYVQPIAAK